MNRALQTRLLLIRHAHIDTAARLCGTLDVPLSPEGHAQLDTLLQQAPPPRPDALYSSSLRRAREVADALSRVWDLAVREADNIHEISCGALEGLPLKELQSHHRELWAQNNAQDDDDFCWPGGESYREFRARVLRGLGAIANAHQGARVAVVTHAGVIAQVLGTLRGRAAAVWDADRPDPLTATEVVWTGGLPRAVLSYNEPDWYRAGPMPASRPVPRR